TTQVIVYPLFNMDVSMTTNLALTAIFTGVSIARGYCVRRLFNWWGMRLGKKQGFAIWIDEDMRRDMQIIRATISRINQKKQVPDEEPKREADSLLTLAIMDVYACEYPHTIKGGFKHD
ncbi:MAG: hypothetical protein FJX23_10755, partial [Alphaproteobacteria bacterium]|nr:hypothetical protein [Alphaproteobacteria bacterium]